MAYTDIDNPELYFQTKLYTGNGSTQSITLDGDTDMQPDWVWLKSRSDAYSHILHDSVRGATKELKSNGTNAEGTDSNGLTSFNSDGFSLGTGGSVNNNSSTYVAWNWKAGGSASSNSNGSITSSVSVSTDAGFSIVTYTGSGSNATVGHGLGSVPQVVIGKDRTNNIGNTNWNVYHAGNTSAPATEVIALNENSATSDSNIYWNDTAPTSSVFSLGTAGQVNDSSDNYVAYCLAEKKGYSKFGSYTGNFSTDGTFVYCGFKPAFIMAKASSRSEDWYVFDNQRIGYNPNNEQLYANSSTTEGTLDYIDNLSNGFKLRQANYGLNGPSETYIYLAFAESPFVNSAGAVPTNAR